MFSISAVVQPVKDSLTELWNGWRGPIILGVGLLLLGALVWHFSAPVAADKLGQLERLKKLLDSGALTQQEFEREKARLLSAP